MTAKSLYGAIENFLNDIREKARLFDEEYGLDPEDPIADVKLKMGGTDYTYTISGGADILEGASSADVSLIFDGAGWDYFSCQSEGAYYDGKYFPPTSQKIRAQLEIIAGDHGYMFEDVTSYSIGFYPLHKS